MAMITTKVKAIWPLSQERNGFAGLPWPRLITCLLVVDGLFILAHLLYTSPGWLTAAGFWLGQDQGYAELWQYLKFAGVIALFGWLAIRQRAPLYFHWWLLFLYLLLDDALQLHENVGHWLATVLALGEGWGLRPRDWGELLVFLLVGLFFLATLTLAYSRRHHTARTFSQTMLLWLVAFSGVAVGLDMVQEAVRATLAGPWLLLAEDGGELLVLSFIVTAVWHHAQAVQQWPQTQVQARVRLGVTALGLFGLFVLLFAGLQYATPGIIGTDGYYHAKMGLLVRQQGLTPTPPQLPLTVLNQADFYNHHLLYHLYLALFATVDPAVDGGIALTNQVKLASLFFPALAFLSIWWLLRQQKIAWPVLWTMALFGLSVPFLYRLSMARAQSASLLLLVWALHCLLQGHYRWLLPLGFVYVWLYNGFPLLWVMVAVYLVTTLLMERRLVWEPLLYGTAGIGLGLLINPYFPENLTFIYHHFVPKLGQLTVPVGNEWYPYDTWQMVEQSGGALLTFAAANLALGWHEGRMEKRTLFLFLLTLVFGGMMFRSRRFVEYFPAFVLVFAAFSLAPLWAKWEQARPTVRKWFPLVFGLLLVIPLYQTVREARLMIAEAPTATKYAAASLWLKAYSPPGSTVFQLDWDDFTRLFFYDSDKVYTVGLDPTYMAQFEPDLYQEWVKITQGQVVRPAPVIEGRFGGDYVFSDLEHEAFLRLAAADPGLVELYRDEEAVIFALVKP